MCLSTRWIWANICCWPCLWVYSLCVCVEIPLRVDGEIVLCANNSKQIPLFWQGMVWCEWLWWYCYCSMLTIILELPFLNFPHSLTRSLGIFGMAVRYAAGEILQAPSSARTLSFSLFHSVYRSHSLTCPLCTQTSKWYRQKYYVCTVCFYYPIKVIAALGSILTLWQRPKVKALCNVALVSSTV